MSFNISDFGAVADGKTLNTEFIQKAIDECFSYGGGQVLVPAGVFKTGTVFLKNNVELHLSSGAILLGSENVDDYNNLDAYEQNWDCVSEEWLGKHIVVGCECENISVTGFGVIDGNAKVYYGNSEENTWSPFGWPDGVRRSLDKEKLRPGQAVAFIECRNVAVKDITIQNTTSWSCYIHGCENVSVSGMKIFNASDNINTDGIDVDSSRYVTVSDCVILTGDDAITFRCDEARLKNKDIHCEYVTVTNCVLSSSAGAFRIGVGTGTIRHIRVSNIAVKRAAVLFNYLTQYGNRGEAKIEDVNFANVSAEFAGFMLKIFAPERGTIKNITVDNVRGNFGCHSFIYGDGAGNVSDITINNVDMNMVVPKNVREVDKKHRGENVFEIKGAENIELNDFKIRGDVSAWKKNTLFENSKKIVKNNCKLK